MSEPPPSPGTSREDRSRRNLGLALTRGFFGRCPNCGRGALFRGYLGVNPRCAACGEDLSAERADDAPAFITLLVVCFVAGVGVLMSDTASPQASLVTTTLIWLIVTAGVSLLILPRIKGAVVGYQWAMRMHGFAAGKR